MRYQILYSFRVKTSQGERELIPGQIISLTDNKAEKLVMAGKIRPMDSELSGRHGVRLSACFLFLHGGSYAKV